MADPIRKTYPELSAQSGGVQDADVLASYRSPGPLKRFTASQLLAYTTAPFGLSSGGTLVNVLNQGTGATAESLQTFVRRFGVYPEQYGAAATYNASVDDTAALQRAMDAAGNWSSANFAVPVYLSRMYKVTATILKRPYTSITGVGIGRGGLMSFMSSGPMMDFDSVVNTSSCYLDDLQNFRLDGTNATGTAYAIRCQGQKHSRWTRLGIWNWENTTVHAVQIIGACYEIVQNQCFYLNNALSEKIAATNPAANLYPTQTPHIDCFYDEGPVNTGSAIYIEDATGWSWVRGGAQSVGAKYLFHVKNNAVPTTTAEGVWENFYVEGNGGGQTGAQTWRFEGDAANPIANCRIVNPRIHGSQPDGRFVYASWTNRLVTAPVYAPGYNWLTDGGNNTNYEVDSRFVAASDLGSYATIAGDTYLITTNGIERARASSAGFSAKAAFLLNNLNFADIDGNFIRIWRALNEGVGIRLGNGSDPRNIYSNTSHEFESPTFGVNYATINDKGVLSSGVLRAAPKTVATLPGSPVLGWRSFVTDANATTFASIVAGGGANNVPVYYDGTNWRIG